jgi:integrase
MSRSSPFVVTRIILAGENNRGERMPFLLERQSRVPVTLAMEWALSTRRSDPVSANTMERELRYLALFEAWLRREKASLHEAMDFVDFFTPSRIEASLRPWLGRDESDRKVKKLSVAPELIRQRIYVVADYVDWVLKNAERSLSVRTQATQALAFDAARRAIAKSFKDVLPTQTNESNKEGLSKQDSYRLLKFVEPTNSQNVWARGNSQEATALRYRNQLIVLLLMAFGPRRGDILKLYTSDVKTHSANPTLWVRRRPDDPHDPRKWEPNAKTQERMLPLDPYLARVLNDYVLEYRKLIPNHKKSPYLFLSTSTGHPLSARALNEVFEALTLAFPGLHPHLCRHTHNDRLREYCRQNGISEKDTLNHTMYLNGWLGDNTGIYTKRDAREHALRISSAVQRSIFELVEDVPF